MKIKTIEETLMCLSTLTQMITATSGNARTIEKAEREKINEKISALVDSIEPMDSPNAKYESELVPKSLTAKPAMSVLTESI